MAERFRTRNFGQALPHTRIRKTGKNPKILAPHSKVQYAKGTTVMWHYLEVNVCNKEWGCSLSAVMQRYKGVMSRPLGSVAVTR